MAFQFSILYFVLYLILFCSIFHSILQSLFSSVLFYFNSVPLDSIQLNSFQFESFLFYISSTLSLFYLPICSSFVYLSISIYLSLSISLHTVDGRNPAPVDRWFVPLFIGFQPSKVMQDFFHPQQVDITAINFCGNDSCLAGYPSFQDPFFFSSPQLNQPPLHFLHPEKWSTVPEDTYTIGLSEQDIPSHHMVEKIVVHII